MITLPFWKMHGAGNDFVVLSSEDSSVHWNTLAQQICDRHRGVGADGLIVVLPSRIADHRMQILNSDGSEAEMCGNGIRCLVKFVVDQSHGQAHRNQLRIETLAGVLDTHATLGDDGDVSRVRVDMGAPQLEPAALGALIDGNSPVLNLPLEVTGVRHKVTLVSMGNPHAVLFCDEPVNAFPLDEIGPALEHHHIFSRRTNVEVVRVHNRHSLEMRVWERGVGETLACGSGASAAVVAARLHDLVDDYVEAKLPGGTLTLEWDGQGEVTLDGPAVKVFEAEWESFNP